MIDYEELVPNLDFAQLLNTEGEIIVDNSIYQITPEGTYCFSIEDSIEFNNMMSSTSPPIEIVKTKDVYLIDNKIIRYDTFKSKESLQIAPDEEDLPIFEIPSEEIPNNTPPSSESSIYSWNAAYSGESSFYLNKLVNSFPTFNADHKTIVGKWIENIIGSKKEFDIAYKTDSNRRIKGSFYDYNYGVYSEIGAQGWTDKKNWIGWSKTESDELYVGWKGIVLVNKIPDLQSESLNRMHNLVFYPPQYMDVPGTKYKLNTSLMIIPDYDSSELEELLSKGV